MTNSNRSPKELKELIEKCKSDDQQFSSILDESMIKLRNISSEEKTEMGMLKERIDEQSRIIMMLKQRCDDYIHKNMALECLNQEMIDQKEKFDIELDELKFKYKQILQRFETLSNYNEEIIRIKDEYKQKNTELKEKINDLNAQLNRTNNDIKMKNLEEEIKFLTNLCRENETQLISLKNENELKINLVKTDAQNQLEAKLNEINELQLVLKEQESRLKTNAKNQLEAQLNQINELQIAIKQQETSLKDVKSLLNDKTGELETKTTQFTSQNKQLSKEKEELSIRLKKIQDDLNNQLSRVNEEKKCLTEKCTDLEKTIKILNEKIKNDSILFNENTFIKKLQAELDAAHKRHEDLQKEFKEYKVYVNNLIEKEKEVNAKLRFLVS